MPSLIQVTGKRVCPHCGNDSSNMVKMISRRAKGNMMCPRCGREIAIERLRLPVKVYNPEKWTDYRQVPNPDLMEYRAPNPGCIFNHRSQRREAPSILAYRAVNKGGVSVIKHKRTPSQPLKVHKRA